MPLGMTPECIAQCWFRFLHTIGNPVELSRPQVISQTPAFLQHALTNDLTDPSLHPCLVTLPANFCKAIKGVASIVDAFLGKSEALVTNILSNKEVASIVDAFLGKSEALISNMLSNNHV